MKIKICSTAGFCYGVARGFETISKEIDKEGELVFYKPFIHNQKVMDRFKEMNGIEVINNLNSINRRKPILKAHGETKPTYNYLAEHDINYIDCVCPNVEAVRKLVIQKDSEGNGIIIIGKHNPILHPEVEGLMSYVRSGAVVQNNDDIPIVETLPEHSIFGACQTTFNSDRANRLFDNIGESLYRQGKYFDYKNTTCNHQRNNIEHSIELCKDSDLAIVYGDKSSSNTMELLNACSEYCSCVFVQDPQQLEDVLLRELAPSQSLKDSQIAILSGASSPKEDLYEIQNSLYDNYNK